MAMDLQPDHEIAKKRAPRARSQGGAECKPRAKSKRIAIDESELAAALVAGKTHVEIADLFRCSLRTVRGRLAEIRSERGRRWPVAASMAAKPAATPPTPIPRHLSREQGEALALRRLAHEAEYAEESRDRIAAAKALLNVQVSEAPPKFPVPRETLISDLARVIEASREPDPGTDSGTPLPN